VVLVELLVVVIEMLQVVLVVPQHLPLEVLGVVIFGLKVIVIIMEHLEQQQVMLLEIVVRHIFKVLGVVVVEVLLLGLVLVVRVQMVI
jgi:hypothetical protein